MAKGLFCTFSEEEILSIQNRAKALLLEGKTIMAWNDGGGTSVTKQMVMPVSEVLAECAYALRRKRAASGKASPPASFVPFRLPL